MTSYEKWRQNEIKTVGYERQLKAEAVLDNHERQPIVEMRDENTGEVTKMRRNVADVMARRKTHSLRKKYFSMPDTSHIDWSRR